MHSILQRIATRWTCVLVAFTLLALIAPAALAQIDDRSNAAYWYNRAIADMQEAKEIQYQFEIADFDAYYAFVEGKSAQAPAIVRRYMRKLPRVFDSMHKAARRDSADYHLDYRQGPGLMLPHLGALRSIVIDLNFDAQMRIGRSDPRGASKNLSTILKVSDHLTDNRLVISSLVAVATFSNADGTIQQGFDEGAFDAVDASAMLRAMRDMPDEDPFGFSEAIAMEQEMMVGWLEGFGDDPRHNEAFGEVLDWSMDDDQHGVFLDSLEETGFQAAIDLFDRAMGRVLRAFLMEDRAKGKEAMAALDKEIKAGGYGPLVNAFMMSFNRTFDQMVHGEEMFTKRKAMLEEIIGGAMDIDDLRNAARLYLKAIEQYDLLSEQDREAIAYALLDPAAVDDGELVVAFAAAELVFETIHEASALDRCNFVELNRWTPDLNLVPEYILGLNKLWRLLHVRAVHSLGNDEVATAAASLSMSLRMIRHMEHAGPMPRPMLAHHWFNQAVALIEQLQAEPEFTIEQRSEIAHTLERISRRDPFGYSECHVYTRRNDISFFGHIWRNDPQWQENVDLHNATVEREWGAARTLYFTAIDELFPADARVGESHGRGDDPAAEPFGDLRDLAQAAHCDDLFDAEAAAAIIDDFQRWTDAIAAGDVTVITDRPDPPQIAAWVPWHRRARVDLRDASAMLPVIHSDQIDDR